ncbi:MAG: hypothetical protein AB7V14_11215 [Kiritimatiellia bacterium]
MDTGKVMRAALAGWLGCAWAAAGRDVPVYREYSRPIAFTDETGVRTADGRTAPDREAQRSLRDAKAQENLLGKETLLDVTFGHGASVFGRDSAVSGKMAPLAGGGEESNRRQRKEESGRNWLAQSLALPGLGQATSNAALSAMSAAGGESSWGWLADDLANARSPGGRPENSVLDGAAENLLADGMDPSRAGGPDPFAESVPRETDRQEEAPKDGSNPGTEKEKSGWATAPDGSDPTDGRALAAPGRSAPMSFVGEMSRTREMLAEMTASVRPDLPSFRMGSETPASRGAGDAATPQASLFSSDAPSWGSISSAGERGRTTFGSVPTEASAGGWGAWKGSWTAQGTGTDGSGWGGLSRFPNPTDPTPAVEDTTPRATFKPEASGGYKPAWY